jgi:hypothetical protein
VGLSDGSVVGVGSRVGTSVASGRMISVVGVNPIGGTNMGGVFW